ncbi:BZ3500_MvSof-1268-A1-R1_C057g00259 [Microbotryum saponariae]|uniref:BZ3500_MvSof-1268-A1-R1_C057g00259 protein n=1 Tax=Microbotryum saponariae TaxID=289078 RepID=A0A2X0KP59_9BASI|nr:BZ3500_MvSof-1268-A1-R1_C057g00259 [Microbotryum saponariae]
MMVAQIMVSLTLGQDGPPDPLPADADSELVAEKYYATSSDCMGCLPPSFPTVIPSSPRSFGGHCGKIGTVLRMSTAAHPETDGSSENRIKMVTQTLHHGLVKPRAWASRLVEAEFALNSSVAVSTSLSAFEATYGYLPRCWPSDSWSVSDVPRAEAFARIRQLRNLDVTDAIIGARLNQSHQANKHRRPDDPAFRTGSYVYLSTKNLAVPDGIEVELPPAMSECTIVSMLDCFGLALRMMLKFPGRDPAVLFVEE